jgi:predicted metalloprotease with PDZ domain
VAEARLTVALAALILLVATSASGQSLEPIRYTLSFPAPHSHYLEVEASYPTGGRAQIDLMMAVWTPGSYMIREYERHVDGLTVMSSGKRLDVEKTRKNRWRAMTGGATSVQVRYRVYAHEMSVRTNWVDEELAVINGAPTFITLVEQPSRRPHEVRVVLPPTWSRSLSALPPGRSENTYVASDYDTLVDSPILAGSPSIYEFAIQGKPHYLVNFRERGIWNGQQAVRDLARAADAIASFWGDMPFDRFYFFNVIGGVRNGLEHKQSALLNTPRNSTRERDEYLAWLSLASHEYFHAWSGKRLHPVELGPFDYENEVYTRALWFVEGVTDYYSELFLWRAGVATAEEFLSALSATVRALQTTPGRLEQSVERASYDAWIEYYRADENSPNTAISYYTKGAVVGFLLDARIRQATEGSRSIDDVMRVLYKRFSGDVGYTSSDLRTAVVEVVGRQAETDFRNWLHTVLETTEELDYRDALAWFGLRMAAPAVAPRSWLGIVTRSQNDRAMVSEVRRGSPAASAGISLLDEIVAINGEPVSAEQFTANIQQFSPQTRVSLTIVRAETTRQIDVVLGTDPGYGWELTGLSAPSREQIQHFDAWGR